MGRTPVRPPPTGSGPLRFDESDRRRLVFASALTVAALPALWLVNQDDSGAGPNVAAVGLAAENGGTGATGAATPADPMGDVDARYLAGSPLTPSPEHVEIAVGSTEDVLVATARATYRRSVRADTCAFSGVGAGERITVVNVDNGRSIECRTVLRSPDAPAGELVMHPDRFLQIADLTSAPIDVEIRQ